MAEIQNGPTISFRPISYEINNKYEEISANVQEIQGDLTRIRNQFKERMVQFYMFNESLNYISFANDWHIIENGYQFRTREGHFMAEILGRARYIKSEIRGSERKSKRVSFWTHYGK